MKLQLNQIFTLIIFTFLFNLSAYSQKEFDEALIVYETGNFSKAFELFTNAVNSKKSEAKSLMYRGDCLINLGKPIEAKKDLEMSLKLDPSTPKIHYFFGRYYLFNGEPNKAINSFTEAIKRDESDDQSYDGRAIAKIQLKDFKGAILDDDYAISLYSQDRTFYNNRGYAKIQIELLEEAIEDFKISLQISPNSKAYGNMGLIYIKKELYAFAINNFSKALSINPNDPEILFYRGQCYEILSKSNDACNDYNKSKTIYDQLSMTNSSLYEAIKRLNCN